MRKLFASLAVLFLLTSFQSCLLLLGGIAVASNSKMNSTTNSAYSDDELAMLKNTTTFFVLRDQDYDMKEAYEKAIRKVWTVTPIEFIFYDELANTTDGRYSYFIMEVPKFKDNAGPGQFFYELPYLRLSLVIPEWEEKKNGKFKDESTRYGMVNLLLKESKNWNADEFFEQGKGYRDLYGSTELVNWKPNLMAAYLKQINDDLITGDQNVNPYRDFKDGEAISKLHGETLLVPKEFIYNWNLNAEGLEPEKIFKKYRGKYKVVDFEELEVELASNKNVYFLDAGIPRINMFFSRVISTKDGLVYARIHNLPLLRANAIAKIK
ncbi:MAG: hypothetical protein AAF741_11895 [Bacteroidota bacterium]